MIQGIDANDPIFGAAGGLGTEALDKHAFMQLLVTQMRNQDPLAPTDNQQFIAQLAQFSSLEEMQGVNENLVALALLQQGNALMSQLAQSSALIGKTVAYTDEATGESRQGVVESVKVVDGRALLSIGGAGVPLLAVTEIKPGAGE